MKKIYNLNIHLFDEIFCIKYLTNIINLYINKYINKYYLYYIFKKNIKINLLIINQNSDKFLLENINKLKNNIMRKNILDINIYNIQENYYHEHYIIRYAMKKMFEDIEKISNNIFDITFILIYKEENESYKSKVKQILDFFKNKNIIVLNYSKFNL